MPATQTSFIARKDRPFVWADRAKAAAMAEGKTGIDVALAAITGGFEGAYDGRDFFNTVKLNAERAIQHGPGSRYCAKYEWYALRSPSGINAALDQLARTPARHAFERMTIAEMRLLLRWMRRRGAQSVFGDVVAQMAEAA